MAKTRVLKPTGTPVVDGPSVIITRNHIGGEHKEIRFTIPDFDENGTAFGRLVAIVRHNKFSWVHKNFIGSFA